MTFFVVKNPRRGESSFITDYIPADPFVTAEAPRCPLCGEATGMRAWLPPYRVDLELWGNEFGDLAFGPGGGLLASEGFVEAYRRAGLTGLAGFHEVTVMRIRRGAATRHEAPTYRRVVVQRSSAAVDARSSGLVVKGGDVCRECRLGGIIKRIERVVIQDNTWSGEDVFIARGLPGTIIASQRFSDVCQENDWRNCVLVPAHDFRFDFYPWERR